MNNPADTLAALAPCPFCGGATRVHSNRDWHRLTGDHDDTCVFVDTDAVMTVPATDECLIEMVAAWNRRASLKGEAEPVAYMIHYPDGDKRVDLSRETCSVGATVRPLIYGDAAQPAPQAVIEQAARYGWQHASWDWEAVKGGLDRFNPTPSPAPQGGGEKLATVVSFLLGEGQLQGQHFGDAPYPGYGRFWWREWLRDAYSERIATPPAQQPGECAHANDVLAEDGVRFCNVCGAPKEKGHGA